MKRLLLVLAVVLTGGTIIAQPTLTAATNSPVPGDVMFGHYCDTNMVREGAAGAAVTWDFSRLNSTITDTTGFIPCAPTPYCSSFPGSTMASPSSGGTGFSYYSGSSSAFSLNGFADSSAIQVYSDPQDVMYFPLTYRSTHYDTGLSTSTGATFHFHDSFACDAYGTVILPTGTYPNALRVHHKNETLIDFFGFITNYYIESYEWYISGQHMPLLSISYDSSAGTKTLANVVYYASLTTAVNPTNRNNTRVAIYPNPVSETLQIDAPANSRYQIFNNIGAVVARGALAGQHSSIDMSNIASGIYFIKISGGQEVTTLRFVKQ